MVVKHEFSFQEPLVVRPIHVFLPLCISGSLHYVSNILFSYRVTMVPEMVMFHKSFEESGTEVLVALTERIEYVPTYIEGLQQSVTEK